MCRCAFFSFLNFTLTTTTTMTKKTLLHSLWGEKRERVTESVRVRWWIVNCLTHRKSQTNHLHLITIYASCLVCMWCNAIQSNRNKQHSESESEREWVSTLSMHVIVLQARVCAFFVSLLLLAKAYSTFGVHLFRSLFALPRCLSISLCRMETIFFLCH